MSNGYPFMSKRAVTEKIASEPAFALECVRLVDERRGWAASHKVRASKILSKIAGGNLSAEDLAEAVSLISPYARTVSRILREREIAEGDLALRAKAAVFGVLRPASAAPLTGAVVQTEAALVPVVGATVADPAAPPKRRPGRPLGSKNRKTRPESEQPKRRRRRS